MDPFTAESQMFKGLITSPEKRKRVVGRNIEK